MCLCAVLSALGAAGRGQPLAQRVQRWPGEQLGQAVLHTAQNGDKAGAHRRLCGDDAGVSPVACAATVGLLAWRSAAQQVLPHDLHAGAPDQALHHVATLQSARCAQAGASGSSRGRAC